MTVARRNGPLQIPPDLVVKFQPTDIVELILLQLMQPSVVNAQEIKG